MQVVSNLVPNSIQKFLVLEGILNLALALQSLADVSTKKVLCRAAECKEDARLNWVSGNERCAVEEILVSECLWNLSLNNRSVSIGGQI